MRRGCFFTLLLYVGCVAAYYSALERRLDPPATWIVPWVFATITYLALGALWGAWDRYREWSLINRARLGLPWADGARAAAVGEINPTGAPLVAPFSGEPAVLYEYELRRAGSPTPNAGDGPPDIGLGWFRLEACQVDDGLQRVGIYGFPDLAEIAEDRPASLAAYARARRFVDATEFDDLSGLKVLRIVSAVLEVMADDDGSVEKNWRRQPDAADWLHTPELDRMLRRFPGGVVPNDPRHEARVRAELAAEEADDQAQSVGPKDSFAKQHETEDQAADAPDPTGEDADDDDEDDAAAAGTGGSYRDRPLLVEKRIAPGDSVCVFGIYSQTKRGLVPNLKQRTVALRLIRGEPAEIENQLRASLRARLIGGLATLVVAHLVLAGGLWALEHNPTSRRQHQASLGQAAADGNLVELRRLLERGVDPNAFDSAQTPPLFSRDPEVVQLLLSHGADPNRPDGSGMTPLMEAARYGRVDIAQQLIAAGANLDALHPGYRSTALVQAIDSEQHETVALLKAAGARDDTVDERSGTAVEPDSPPSAVCLDYLSAIHARDPRRLLELSSNERGAEFTDIDWDIWHHTRPVGDVQIAGFANSTAATIRVRGLAPKGFPVTWVFQLVSEDGQWRVRHEREETKPDE